MHRSKMLRKRKAVVKENFCDIWADHVLMWKMK